jgi:hypothetical protein
MRNPDGSIRNAPGLGPVSSLEYSRWQQDEKLRNQAANTPGKYYQEDWRDQGLTMRNALGNQGASRYINGQPQDHPLAYQDEFGRHPLPWGGRSNMGSDIGGTAPRNNSLSALGPQRRQELLSAFGVQPNFGGGQPAQQQPPQTPPPPAPPANTPYEQQQYDQPPQSGSAANYQPPAAQPMPPAQPPANPTNQNTWSGMPPQGFPAYNIPQGQQTIGGQYTGQFSQQPNQNNNPMAGSALGLFG